MIKLYHYAMCALFLTCHSSWAESAHDETVHFAAHAGTSYIINEVVYGIMHKGLGADRATSLWFSVPTTLALGLTYKMMEMNASNSDIGKSMIYNGIGVLGSVVIIHGFDF